jgi:hypothetical protein
MDIICGEERYWSVFFEDIEAAVPVCAYFENAAALEA